MNECKKCGKCCEDIYLNKEIIVVGKKNNWQFTKNCMNSLSGVKFMEKNWVLIKSDDNGFTFYCKLFDKKTRLCTAYSVRPNVCKYYPLYKEHKKHKMKASNLRDGCGFKKD